MKASGVNGFLNRGFPFDSGWGYHIGRPAAFAQSPVNLRQALDRWLALTGPGKKESTRHYYAEIVAAIILCFPSAALERAVEDLTEDDFARFAVSAGHYSPTRWNGMLTALHATVPAARGLRRRSPQPAERRPPSQAEFSRLLAECDKLPRSKVGLIVRFLGFTGLRIREASLLRWQNVGPECLEVPGSITKNSKPRLVPILPALRETLDRLRAVTGKRERILPYAHIRRGLEKACVRAGIAKLCPHDFRRMFATRCIESGVDLPTAARWLGHSDGGGLLAKTYFRLLDEHSRAMAQRVRF